MEAIRYFADLDVATEFVAKMRWGSTTPTVCPRLDCQGTEFSYLTSRRLWKCKACKAQSSVKVGTIFEDSPIPLDKWLCAIWLIANSKNGISSHELGRSIGLSQKSAWFVNHRIRLAMRTGTFEMLDGTVEVDESVIGGKVNKMNRKGRERIGKTNGKGGSNKTVVVGAVERGGKVVAKVVPDTTRNTLENFVYDNVIQGSTVYTDGWHGYRDLALGYNHASVNHADGEYGRGDVSSNTIENFWSVLKRSLGGTYVSVQPFHLARYLDERMFAFNERHQSDQGRFLGVVGMVSGRRLTWAELTGKG